MKPKNNPTFINFGEDLYKFLFFAVDEKIYVSNVISPEIIERLADISSNNMKSIYFDSNEVDDENKVKLIRNRLVEFKLNKKNDYIQAKVQILF